MTEFHADGRKIVRCRTLAGVKRAFAAGAIAHLITGSIVVNVDSGNVTLWASGSATATMRASGSATATMWASDSATADMWAYDSATATMWAYDSATATMWASGSAKADMWASGSAKADMWASGSAKADMRASGSATATMWASGSAKADMRAYDSATADMCWTSTAEPSPETAARLKYRMPDDATADANIREVAEFVKRERALFAMGSWHSRGRQADGEFPCGTTHCMAGAAVMLKGEDGRKMEELFGTEQAALLILGREAASYFHRTESDQPALDFLSAKLGEPIA